MLTAQLRSSLSAPFVYIGNEIQNCITVTISWDTKDQWTNGILENSKATKIFIRTNDRKIETVSTYGHRTRFRKAGYKTSEQCIEKLQKYIDKVSAI